MILSKILGYLEGRGGREANNKFGKNFTLKGLKKAPSNLVIHLNNITSWSLYLLISQISLIMT